MLDIFKFESYKIRIFIIDDVVWFVAIDVATILGYVDSSMMLKHVEDEDKRVENPHNLDPVKMTETFSSNTFRVVLINESGLYACIFGSTKAEAKTFKRWVTSELLPTIRKTGKYEVSSNINSQKALIDAVNLMAKMSEKLDANDKLLKQSLEGISILEDEKFHREYYLEKINQITKEHPLFRYLLEFKLLIKTSMYQFPSVGYSIKELSNLFPVRKISLRDFAFYSSHLYFLNLDKKPDKKGVYKYSGEDLVYPLVILFKIEEYTWDTLRNSLELDYKLRFPNSNRPF